MKKTGQQVWAVVLSVLAGWVLVTGCESTSSTESLITVTPATADLSGAGSTLTLTASTATNTMVLPLVWSVNDSRFGRIQASGGVMAVYESTGVPGTSTITVNDQTTGEGIAVVWQR